MLKQKLHEKKKAKLATKLSLGTVNLNVKNLLMMKQFYQKVIGLDSISENSESVVLGKESTPLLALYHTAHLDQAEPGNAGLYHFAIVFSSRGDLARTVKHILTVSPESFAGSGDHLVSEAFYFTDPEGNGIELYYDRDSSNWSWENNQIKMATLYIDPVQYIHKNIVLEEPNSHIKMGHIHLKVGNIEKAKQFYVDVLGFDVTAELPGALFISVGGYHHHLGMNTWESSEAEERLESLGLKKFEIKLEDADDIKSLKERLKAAHIEFVEENKSIILQDPWKNTITMTY